MRIPNSYIAPITLGSTPHVGDLICGTVNGVDVNGECTGTGGKTIVVKLKRVDDPDTTICAVEFLNGRAVVIVYSDSAPTTDYELHLYRYVPAGIVKIPLEYIDGLEYILSYDELFLLQNYPVLTPTQLSLISDINASINDSSIVTLSSNSAYSGASLKIDGYGIIINSSTHGSTKKFRITVDDTGTISATEVTT